MKTTVFFFLILLTFKAAAFGGVHDSLLFDGASDVQIYRNYISEDCKIKVSKVAGFAIGSIKVKEIILGCGDYKDTAYRTISATQLKEGDNIVKREEIRTGEDGYVKLDLADGSVIVVGPNSSLYIDEEICEETRTLVRFKFGIIWTKIKKLLGGAKYEVTTERNGGGVRGTEFSIEVTEDKEVIKVFEGTFEVYPLRNPKALEDASKEMEKLTEDFQSGKITMEEYTAKINESTVKITELSENASKSIMLEAGNMVTITDRISSPEPIPASELKWFEEFAK